LCRRRTVRGTRLAAEQAARHPARPEQYVEGFETGYEQVRETPEELRGPNFARGIAREEPAGPPPQRRFSEGIEQTPDEGVEQAPEQAATRVERRFSEGVAKRPTSS
jgi:hypothetical protein